MSDLPRWMTSVHGCICCRCCGHPKEFCPPKYAGDCCKERAKDPSKVEYNKPGDGPLAQALREVEDKD